MSDCHLEFYPAYGVHDLSLDPDFFIRAKCSCSFVFPTLQDGAGS